MSADKPAVRKLVSVIARKSPRRGTTQSARVWPVLSTVQDESPSPYTALSLSSTSEGEVEGDGGSAEEKHIEANENGLDEGVRWDAWALSGGNIGKNGILG